MQGVTISNIKFFLHNNEVFHFIEKILTNFVPFHSFSPLRFSDIFSGYRKGALETNEFILSSIPVNTSEYWKVWK